ncbi:MAG: pilin [bacterium]|nr:pilin [bacterium]
MDQPRADGYTQRRCGTPRAKSPRRWIFVLGFVFAFFLVAAPVFALETGLGFGTATGLSTQDIRVTIAKIIRVIIGILGIIALIVVLAGGFMWMTSGGEEEKIAKGKKILTNGAIGLVIIFLSFSITQFIISRLTSALGFGGTVSTAGGFVDDVFLSGALGAGPIESHYPARGAGDIPRNTRIFVTFRDAVDPATLAADSNGNNTIGTTGEDARAFDNYQDLALPESIQVMRVGTSVDPLKLTALMREQDPAAFAAEAAKLTPVGVALAPGGKTIVLSPVATEVVGDQLRAKVNPATGFVERAFLGSADAPTAYLVRLTSAIKKTTKRADGTPEDLFTGAFREYAWDFTVSTTIDLTPPQITSVIPFPDGGRDTAEGIVGVPDQPRNVIVQVNFNEAVDPTVTTGTAPAFTHLAVTRDGTRQPGTFAIGNQYRTVEFTTDTACGQNSCGGTVYCLPGNAVLQSVVEAAQLEAGGPSGLPFSGVMDAAGNSLDGNANTRAEGPGTPGAQRFDRGDTAAENAGASDSVQWQFATNDTIDLTAPEVLEVAQYPKQGDLPVIYGGVTSLAGVENVSLTKPVELLFSKLMSGNVASGIALTEDAGCNETTGTGCLWYMTFGDHEDTARDADDAIDATRASISHAAFRDVQAGFDIPIYRVRVDSSVKDITQNCLFTVASSASDPPTPLPIDQQGPRGPAGGQTCVGAPGQERDIVTGQLCLEQ